MKKYISPEFEEVKYSADDVIVCSGGSDGEIGKDENEVPDD